MRVVSWMLLAGCELAFPLRDRDASLAIDAPESLECPASYEAIGDGKYRFSLPDDHVIWTVANANCKADRTDGSGFTHLAVLGSDVELAQLVASGRLPVDTSGWIGLIDEAEEGVFRWITGEEINPLFPPAIGGPWNPGEPNNQNDEDCVTINASGGLNDSRCPITTTTFICECDGFASDL